MMRLRRLVYWPVYDLATESKGFGYEPFAELGELTGLTHLSLNGMRQLTDEGMPQGNCLGILSDCALDFGPTALDGL